MRNNKKTSKFFRKFFFVIEHWSVACLHPLVIQQRLGMTICLTSQKSKRTRPSLSISLHSEKAATASHTPVMTSEFLSIATFVLIFTVMCFVIKIFKIVKNSQAIGNETAAVENNWANQRALTAARDFDDHYPGGEGISYQRFLWNDRILRGTPAIRRLPRHHDERFHYPSAEGISNQRFLCNDRILGGTPAIRRLPRHKDGRFQ